MCQTKITTLGHILRHTNICVIIREGTPVRAEPLIPLITQADIFHSRNVTCNLDENQEFLPFLLRYPDPEMDDTLIHEHSASVLTYYGYTHAIIQEGSCKLQLQGRKSLTWSEDNLLSHNVFDIWISGLWNVLRIRWVLHITFEIRMNCPNAWIIMNDNPCWLYLYPEHEVYRSPCPQCPTLHSPDTTRQGQRWVSAAAAGCWHWCSATEPQHAVILQSTEYLPAGI